MTRALKTLTVTSETELKIGTGLDSGSCCISNLCSAQRFSNSAVCDGVNVASRSEGMKKAYGLSIIASENVRAGAADLAFLGVDLVRVVGRQEPLPIFGLIGDGSLRSDPGFESWRTATRR